MSTTRHHLAKRPLAALAMGAAAMLALSACGGGSESGESGESGAAAGGGFESSDSAYDAIHPGGSLLLCTQLQSSERLVKARKSTRWCLRAI